MLVYIEREVYNEVTLFPQLNRLIWLFEDEKHNWEIDDPELIKKSKWAVDTFNESYINALIDLIEKTTVKSLQTGKKKKQNHLTITIQNPDNEKFFTMDVAYKILKEAVYIIVENSFSDKAFIKCLIKAYNHKQLSNALEEEWLKIDGAGGKGQIPEKIEEHFKACPKPRLFVLVDSDKLSPIDHHKAEIIEEKCIEKNIRCAILYKREIENYLPDEALKKAEPSNLHYLFTLTPEQRDFYDMKKGFGKGELPKGQEDLFNNINSKDDLFKALRSGVQTNGEYKLHDLFSDPEVITKEALKRRCKNQPNPDELEKILEDISLLL